eukprot:6300587-Amphidinium_carterae.1
MHAAAVGTLETPHSIDASVYEAELRAVIAVIAHASWHVDIVTDNAAVVRGWQHGPSGTITRSG